MAAPHSEAFSAGRMVFESTVLVERCRNSRSGMTERLITPMATLAIFGNSEA